LCYAWDKLEEKDVVDVDPAGITELADLFARVLINGTNHLLKRGFDRNYVAHTEWTGRLRGKIKFEAIAKTGAITATLPCDFGELSYDVLHNQLLKATIHRLIRPATLSRENAEALAAYCGSCPSERCRVISRLFGQVQLHRNNRFYDFLMKVCELDTSQHADLGDARTKPLQRLCARRKADGHALRGIRQEFLPDSQPI